MSLASFKGCFSIAFRVNAPLRMAGQYMQYSALPDGKLAHVFGKEPFAD